jgi:hypothetical protein
MQQMQYLNLESTAQAAELPVHLTMLLYSSAPYADQQLMSHSTAWRSATVAVVPAITTANISTNILQRKIPGMWLANHCRNQKHVPFTQLTTFYQSLICMAAESHARCNCAGHVLEIHNAVARSSSLLSFHSTHLIWSLNPGPIPQPQLKPAQRSYAIQGSQYVLMKELNSQLLSGHAKLQPRQHEWRPSNCCITADRTCNRKPTSCKTATKC